MKRNKFSKALKQLKSTELDERIKSLEESVPTNSIGGVYALNQPGQRLGPYDPPKVFYPDTDGNWPDGIPGTPGERSYTRPAGHWEYGPGAVPSVDWDNTVDFSHSGTSTDGFIDPTTGAVLSNLPPDSSNFILGPLVDGYVYVHGYDDRTNIGYIQKDTRQFMLLASIPGYWRSGSAGNAGAGRNPARQWDGETITIYNPEFTLEMAQWFRDQYVNGTYIKNVSYFYPGGQPQSDNPDPNAPPGSKGGIVGGAGSGGGPDEEGPYGSGGDPNIGTPQNPPNGGGPEDAGFPWELFDDLKDWLFGKGKKKKKPDEKYGPAFGDDEEANKERDKLIRELEKNMDQYGDDPKVEKAVNDWNDALYKAGGGDAAQREKGQTRDDVIDQGRKNLGLPPTPPPKRGQGGRPLGDTTQRGGKGGSGPSGSGSGSGGSSGGGGAAGSGTGTGSGTRQVSKPYKKGGLPVETVYRGMPKDSADLTRKGGTKETGTTLGRKGVSTSKDQNVARSYADENPLTRGTPFGNKTGEVWKGRIPKGAGTTFRGATVLSKKEADTAFQKNLNKGAKPPKRSGPRPKAGTTTRVPGMPTGGGGGGLVRPIEPWIGKTDPLQGYTYNYRKGTYELANSNIPQGEVLSESKKKILREVKKPYILPEAKKEKIKHRPKVIGASPRIVGADMMKKAECPTSFKKPEERLWGRYEKNKNARMSQERKNEVLDLVGTSDHAWEWLTETSRKKTQDIMYGNFGEKGKKIVRKEQLKNDYLVFIVDENGNKEQVLQSKLNSILSDKFDREIFAQYFDEQETIRADKDPLFRRVSNKLKPIIDYPDKPSKAGYPNDPPPEMVNGWHPEYGQDRGYYNKLDPQSAAAMPSTDNPVIDAKVQKAKRLKEIMKKKA